jgi:hypothetical protein
LQIECRECATPEDVTTETPNVTLNSSGFPGILNGKYDLVVIDIHARKEFISWFIIHYLVSSRCIT